MSEMKNQYDSVSLVSLFEGQTNNPIYQDYSLLLSIFHITLNLPHHSQSHESRHISQNHLELHLVYLDASVVTVLVCRGRRNSLPEIHSVYDMLY